MGVLAAVRDHAEPRPRRRGDGPLVGRGRHRTRSACAAFDARPAAVRGSARRAAACAPCAAAGISSAVALASLGVAGGVMAVDRAIDAGAVHLEIRGERHRASCPSRRPDPGRPPRGRRRFVNDDPSSTTGSSRALANVDANARPGQTQEVRFRIDEPGT